MESGIQSSFIPHDAGQQMKPPARRGAAGLGDLLLILGIVALAASAALAAAVFLYQQYLQSSAASDLAQLQRAQQQFQPSLVEQLTRLDDRMQAAQTLLHTHLAPSVVFDMLDQVTLKTISYSTFSFDAGDPNHLQIKMQGVAQSVNSIALQNDLMTQSGMFTSSIFSNIDRQPDGVHFQVTALVNPAPLNFAQLASGGAAPEPQLLQPTTNTSASSTQGGQSGAASSSTQQ